MAKKTKSIIGITIIAFALLFIGIAQKSKGLSGFFAFLQTGKFRAEIAATSSLPNSKNSSASAAVSQLCDFNSSLQPDAGEIVFKEVAWMGDKDSPSNEWFSIKKTASGSLDISGYQIINKSQRIQIIVPPQTVLSDRKPDYVLARNNGIFGVNPDAVFSSAIKNSDEGLRLFDNNCWLLDQVLANPDWPAGAGPPDYLRAMRSVDLSWHTYGENITKAGAINFAVSSSVPSILTGAISQDVSSVAPAAESSSSSVVAPVLTATSSVVASTGSQSVSSPPDNSGPAHVLISEVMAGAEGNAKYEFIEIYNPSSEAVDLTGWTIKKKSSTGKESTLVSSSHFDGKNIRAGGYFLLANETGYNGNAPADLLWPSSYTLAYTNNGITLLNQKGEAADAVNWSEIPAGKSFSRASWTGGDFIISDPTPQNSSSA